MKNWGRPEITVRPADVADCDTLSEIHSAGFQRGWSGAEFEALLVQPGVHALLAQYRSTFGSRTPAGFVLYRVVGNEAEILSIAVTSSCRRRGIGRRLLEETLRHLYREGAASLHLEVEDANAAALALYQGMDFRESGRRKNYYAQGRPAPAGALVMVRQLR